MRKSRFRVSKMDCSAEESLLRLKLGGISAVKSLEFDLADRTVTVYHVGEPSAIEFAISQLELGSELVETGQAGAPAPAQAEERRLLWTVLAINFGFFVLELTTGLLAGSMGLIADSLDMLADAFVYGLSLFAVGATAGHQKNVAKWSGYFQITLAVVGFIEVLRRFFGVEDLPHFKTMIAVSAFALIANSACLYLLQRTRNQEAHIQASMIFTSNDVVINLGVIAAGVLVLWLQSGVPDLVIGAIVFAIVSLGARRILQLAA